MGPVIPRQGRGREKQVVMVEDGGPPTTPAAFPLFIPGGINFMITSKRKKNLLT